MDRGKHLLSELKLYNDYLKWREDLGRYERWEEACDDVFDTHKERYKDIWKIKKLKNYVEPSLESYKDKLILASQRNLQFRGQQILSHNARLYNCCTTYCYSPDVFAKGFYVLLCGAGLGVSMRQKYIKKLPKLKRRGKGVLNYEIKDSIEGWADAVNVLISSFCAGNPPLAKYQGYKIRFDYSQIRPKGAYISGGFKAPGPDGLKDSMEKIESLLENVLSDTTYHEFDSIIAYDIFMHLSNAVLSGGVRRSAMNIIFDYEDKDLLHAKTGNWWEDNPQRARSNNSVGLIRGKFTEKQFKELLELNNGGSDVGFVFAESEDMIYNPCFEISFCFYKQIEDYKEACFQFCNLNEINAVKCVDKYGDFDKIEFFRACRDAATLGTLQAGYTSFPYLGKATEKIVEGEALLGVSITGMMANPEILDPEILSEGARIVKDTNKIVSEILGINSAARTTCVKPSGNSSVILGCPSGIHPEHSKRYFRIMQLNKESEIAKNLKDTNPNMLEESLWSATKSDYVVYVPIENSDEVIYKEEMKGVKHLEVIKMVQNSWVYHGKDKERCYQKDSEHNVSNTVIIDDYDSIVSFVFENQKYFAAVSFLTEFGDKDYAQAPFTSVLTTEEILERYGDGAMFASGLIVDGLHTFDNNLWEACSIVLYNKKVDGTRLGVLVKEDWVRRVNKFAKTYFNNDLVKCIYCLKDVHLWHKWNKINKTYKKQNLEKALMAPKYSDISEYAAIACSGGSCEITKI